MLLMGLGVGVADVDGDGVICVPAVGVGDTKTAADAVDVEDGMVADTGDVCATGALDGRESTYQPMASNTITTRISTIIFFCICCH